MREFGYTWEDQIDKNADTITAAILAHNLSPYESDILLVKTAATENVGILVESVEAKLGIRYVDRLERFVTHFNENADMSQDEDFDYISNGRLTAEFESGLFALRRFFSSASDTKPTKQEPDPDLI